MLCKDCEMEVNHLVSTTDTCDACYKRMQNCKYRGIDYVPLKDIKGTSEYNRAMGKRLKAAEKNSVKKVPAKRGRKPKKAETKDYIIKNVTSKKDDVILEVENDINHLFEEKGAKQNVNYLPLDLMFNWLHGLCQEDNYIKDLELTKQLYDTLIVGYLHVLKNPESDLFTDTEFANISRKMKVVQNKRTPIDFEIDKYNIVKPVFDYLHNDKTFLDLISDCRIELIKFLNNSKNPTFKSNIESLKDYSFVTEAKEEKIRKISTPKTKISYAIQIKNVRGLYGNQSPQTFKYDKPVYAESVEMAKKNFKSYLKDAFPNIAYRDEDMQVVLYSEKESL